MNLVGYCAEKGQHMLVYVYMSKGSLASHLYGKLKIYFLLEEITYSESIIQMNEMHVRKMDFST